jgi:hypothetical protein
MSPCLVAAYAAWPLKPLTPAPDEGVDDHAAPVPEHELDLVLHAQEGAAEVDRHEAVPLAVADLASRLDRLLDTRVVEGDVQATEPLDGGLQRRFDVLAAHDVARHRKGLAACLLDHAGRLLIALSCNVGDHHARPFAGERQGGRATDAAGRSGDERDFPVEAAAHGVTMTLIDSRSAIAR